ncbi:hypothetical protein MW887_003943 [Aspergillus wentii]|nr:hypothetical protein MW887_003943 [Aspergillus wentii]
MSTQEADRELKDPDRAELIAEFGRRIGLEEFNLTAWLFLWFSDITALRKRVEDAAGEGFQSISINVFGPGRKPVFDEVLKSWLARPDQRNENTYPDMKPFERDQKLIPLMPVSRKRQEQICSHRVFGFTRTAQIEQWRELVTSDDCRTEFLGNLITFTSDGEGNEQFLDLEFYYIPARIPTETITVCTRPTLSSVLTEAPGGIAVADYEKRAFLASGH